MGVHRAAIGLDGGREGVGGTLLGAFEHHMLDEMGDAVRVPGFVACADTHPGANDDALGFGHAVGCDT